MMNVCLLQRKEVSLKTSKRRRSQNLFYTVLTYVNRQNLRIEVENVLHLLFYILKKEKANEDVLGEGLPIYDGIYFCLYLFLAVIIKE